MIVDDLNVGYIAVLPAKTNAPLIVDTDGVLACPISPQSFEPKARRLEIIERSNLVQERKTTLGCAFECLEPCNTLTLEEALRLLRPEVSDHMAIIVCSA